MALDTCYTVALDTRAKTERSVFARSSNTLHSLAQRVCAARLSPRLLRLLIFNRAQALAHPAFAAAGARLRADAIKEALQVDRRRRQALMPYEGLNPLGVVALGFPRL